MKCKFLVALGVLTTLCLPLFGGNDTTTYLELKDLEESSEKKDKTISNTDRENETTLPKESGKKSKKKKRSTIYTILKAGVYIFLLAGGAIDVSNISYNVNYNHLSLTSLPWNATLPESTSNCTYSYHDDPPICEQNYSFGETQEAPKKNNDFCYILEKCGEVSYEQPQLSLNISSLILRSITLCGTVVYDWVTW